MPTHKYVLSGLRDEFDRITQRLMQILLFFFTTGGHHRLEFFSHLNAKTKINVKQGIMRLTVTRSEDLGLSFF